MAHTADDVLAMIKDNEVRFVDLRFTDPKGKQQHVTLPAHAVDADLFTEGKMFDGSSIDGWKGINESDMILMPDADTAMLDPFFDDMTLTLVCQIIEPNTMQGYGRDPRSIAQRARPICSPPVSAMSPTSAPRTSSSCLMTSGLPRT